MKKQTYLNHKRYYPPHHFIFLPMMAIMIVFGLWNAYSDQTRKVEWIMFAVLSFCILYLAIMLRQHYALGNQDRIVRLEFRLRCFELLGKQSQKFDEKLSFSQIAALRFASDDEFTGLLDRELKENLSGDEIKKSVRNWQADSMRV